MSRRVGPDGEARGPGVDVLDLRLQHGAAARLIAWLVSDEGRWMTGQVLHSEGGFRR
jgi:NAD(P)-dependent dehydrogenase (short-subunit alcohol dehydrogenase family)